MNVVRNRFTAVVPALAAGALVASSNASAIDVTSVVSEISGTVATVGLIGAAVLLVIVAIKAFQWVRRAF